MAGAGPARSASAGGGRLQHSRGCGGPRRRRRGQRRRLPADDPHRQTARGRAGASMTPSLQGALVGLLAVTGLLVVVARVPAFRRPRLEDRLAPYLRDTPRPSRLLGTTRPLTPF